MYTLHDIRKIAPGYRGKVEIFDINKVKSKQPIKSHKQCIEESKHFPIFIAEGDELRQATPSEAEEFRLEQSMGFVKTRASYRRNTDYVSPVRSERLKQDPTLTEDCFRCLLVKRGTIFLPESIICTCAVEVHTEKIMFEEKTAKDEITPWTSNDETHMFANEEILKQKTNVSNCKPLFEIEAIQTATHVISIHGKTKSKINTTPKHTLTYYAPPGYGKACLQRNLASRKIHVVETDSCKGLQTKDIPKLLEYTSVLTNRLEFVKETEVSCIAIKPICFNTFRKRVGKKTGVKHLNRLKEWYSENAAHSVLWPPRPRGLSHDRRTIRPSQTSTRHNTQHPCPAEIRTHDLGMSMAIDVSLRRHGQ
jgi:hypothetical protein